MVAASRCFAPATDDSSDPRLQGCKNSRARSSLGEVAAHCVRQSRYRSDTPVHSRQAEMRPDSVLSGQAGAPTLTDDARRFGQPWSLGLLAVE